MNHYPRNGQEGDLEFSTRKVSKPSIPNVFICDTSTTWIVSMQETGLDWITFSTQVGLNASSTSLIRKISHSKHYPVEKPPNETSSLESTDLESHLGMINPACLSALQFKILPRSLVLQSKHEFSLQLLTNISQLPLTKKQKTKKRNLQLSPEIISGIILLR